MTTPQCLCPFLDSGNARCAGLWTLMNLREAFRLCAHDHESCSIYHRIRVAEIRAVARLAPPQLASA